MAGVAVNVGLGGITALLGIAHAAVQTDLVEVVAYSNVENGGLIAVGYGTALVGAVVQIPTLVAVGLLAATLQVVTHALAKSLLFCATSGLEDAAGTTELDLLGGVGRRLRASATALAVGAVTLAGLPLTIGFVSEWFLLESLMQQFRLGRLDYALPMAIAGALVALTAGFAAVAFVRKVLANVLLTRSELVVLERETGGRTDDPHRDAAGAHLGYTADVVEVVEHYVFRPLGRVLLAAVSTARRMQNGRLDAYLAYMLIAVIAVLAVVAGLV
jgi:formate hydrogenlyase subunit 3/multisubunit Na+/H+ antiporter MnhD subunit